MYSRGFTLLEMLVVIAIVSIITTIVFANQGIIGSSFALRSSADEIVLTIREAQVKALAVSEFDGTFENGFGIHFNTDDNDKTAVFFADKDGDNIYDDISEKIKDIELNKNVSISSVSASGTDCSSGSSVERFNAVFKGPRPEAIIKATNDGGQGKDGCSELKITVTHGSSGEELLITLLPNADISVKKPD